MNDLILKQAQPIATRQPRSFSMGQVLSSPGQPQFLLNEWHMEAHALVVGQTRMGKSKFLERLMRYLTVYGGGGFALIDPHGDLAEDILAFAAHRKYAAGERNLHRRVHYLEPSYEQVFHYNPFKFRPLNPIPEQHRGDAMRAWLHAKSDRIGEIIQRKQGDMDFQGMARLQRVLTNVLIAVGSAQVNGRFLPLSDALVLLQLEHERHSDVFRCVEPHLEPEIRAEFQRFHSYKNPYQYLNEAESTINRLRSLLSPLVKAIFAEEVNTIDFYSIIQNGDILLLNLAETDYFSADQRSAIGGLFIHELLSTAQNAPRDQRKKFTLIVDEAPEFIGADIDRALSTMGKFKMSICLAGQNLESFKKGDLDLRPKVLSQCHTIVTYQQRWPEDLELLARVLGTGNLDFTKHFQVVDRPDGYDFIPMKAFTEMFTWGQEHSNGFAVSESESVSHESGQVISDAENRSASRNWHQARDRAISAARARTRNPHGRELSNSDSQSYASRESASAGGAESASNSHSVANSSKVGHATQHGTQRSESDSESMSQGESVTESLQPLARTREERHETPNLMNSVADQFEAMRQIIHGLGERNAVALLRGEQTAFVFQTANVDEKWSEDNRRYFLDEMKKLLAKTHPYFSKPDLSPEAQNKRLDVLVGTADDELPEAVAERLRRNRQHPGAFASDADELMS